MSNTTYTFVRYAPGVDKKAIRQARFAVFVNQYGDEQGQRHGWKSDLARKLKKTPSAVSQYAAGTLKADTDTVQLAAEVFGIDPSYFADPRLGESPDYKKFVNIRGSVRATAHATATITAVHDDPLSTWDRFLLMPEAQRLSNKALAEAKIYDQHGANVTAETLLALARAVDASDRAAESGDIVTGTRPIFREQVPVGKRALAPAKKR